MKRKLHYLFNSQGIPAGVKVLTFSTSVRWFGWGFAEALLPVFIFSFSKNFAEAGLLRSSYEIGLILALPLIGLAADRVRASSLILIGLFMYFFIGASYLLAGATGLVIFVVLARLTNGVAFAFDSVGRSTYFRRHSPPDKIATVFGYFDTVANFWWIIAALIGIILIRYFSIPTLLFMVTPTAMLAFLIVWKFRKKDKELVHPVPQEEIASHSALVRLFGQWSWPLRSLIILNFFIACASAIVVFFLPIEAYNEGANLGLIALFGIVAAVPSVFGWGLGKWFDVKGTKSFVYALVLFAALVLSIPFVDGYVWKLAVAFMSGMILEFLSVGNNELVSAYANPEHFGQVEGVMRSIGNIGALAGPLIIGITMDSFGLKASYTALAILLFVLAIVFNLLNKYGFLTRRSL